MGPLSRERWSVVQPVLDGALALAPARRPAFQDDACGEDTTLRAEVDALLAAGERVGGILDTPAAIAYALLLDEPAPPLPSRLAGRYHSPPPPRGSSRTSAAGSPGGSGSPTERAVP
jgi:hypothetical protein